MIVAESGRFPELARAVFETGQAVSGGLARLLHQAMARGELRNDDAAFAADILLSLLTGTQRDQLLFGLTPDPATQADRAVRIIDCFLQAYAPRPTSKRIEGKPE
jgi:hypothetical protein